MLLRSNMTQNPLLPMGREPVSFDPLRVFPNFLFPIHSFWDICISFLLLIRWVELGWQHTELTDNVQ